MGLGVYVKNNKGFGKKEYERNYKHILIGFFYGNLYGDSVSCSLCPKEEKMIEKKNDKERDTAVCLPVAKRARKNEGDRNK